MKDSCRHPDWKACCKVAPQHWLFLQMSKSFEACCVAGEYFSAPRFAVSAVAETVACDAYYAAYAVFAHKSGYVGMVMLNRNH